MKVTASSISSSAFSLSAAIIGVTYTPPGSNVEAHECGVTVFESGAGCMDNTESNDFWGSINNLRDGDPCGYYDWPCIIPELADLAYDDWSAYQYNRNTASQLYGGGQYYYLWQICQNYQESCNGYFVQAGAHDYAEAWMTEEVLVLVLGSS